MGDQPQSQLLSPARHFLSRLFHPEARATRSKQIQTRLVYRLRWFYVTRYSWLVGVLLFSLPFVCVLGLPGLLANLFVLDGPVQLFNVSWICMVIATITLVTYRISEMNAPARFDDYRRAQREYLKVRALTSDDLELRRRSWRLRWVLLWVMWAPVPLTCLFCTWRDPEPVWDRVHGVYPWDPRVGLYGLTAVFCGVVTGLVLILLAALIERNVLAPNAVAKGLLPFEGELLHLWHKEGCERRGSHVSRKIAAFLTCFGPGYHVEMPATVGHHARGDAQVALGHTQQALFTGLIVAFYVGTYGLGWGFDVIPGEHSPLPALYFALIALLMAACILPGLAFFFDRYRIPVLLVGMASTFMMYLVCETDHYYSLNPPVKGSAEQRQDPFEPLVLEEIFDHWCFPEGRDGKRTLVVIDASGGGIQASAWTAQVLTGLDEIYGHAFSRSIGMISAVSGGSVGSMFYLIHRPELQGQTPLGQGPILTPSVASHIRETSAASALEATTWGIAYPDLMRAIFPPLAGRSIDRGWAIEQVWRRRMVCPGMHCQDLSDLRLTDLAARVRDHQLPVVAFNSTLVETGQRLVLSPVASRSSQHADDSTALSDVQEFFRLYGPQAHIRVSTAVRLSATFPYVSPVCRPLAPPGEGQEETPAHSWHAADGAYSDNEGVVTSVHWVNRLLDYHNHEDRLLSRPFDRVLLIRIQPFPTESETQSAKRSSGWVNAMAGPLTTMLNVRVASQIERGNLEVRLLSKATDADRAARREQYATQQRSAEQAAGAFVRDAARGRVSDTAAPTAASLAIAAQQVGQQNVDELVSKAREQAEHAQTMLDELDEIEVRSIRFVFRHPNGHRAPLSWKLTASQKRAIETAWMQLVTDDSEDSPLIELDEWFERLPQAVSTPDPAPVTATMPVAQDRR